MVNTIEPEVLNMLSWPEKLDMIDPLIPIPVEKSRLSAAKQAASRANKSGGKRFSVKSVDNEYFLIRLK